MANVIKQMIKVQGVILCPVRVTFGDGGGVFVPWIPPWKREGPWKKLEFSLERIVRCQLGLSIIALGHPISGPCSSPPQAEARGLGPSELTSSPRRGSGISVVSRFLAQYLCRHLFPALITCFGTRNSKWGTRNELGLCKCFKTKINWCLFENVNWFQDVPLLCYSPTNAMLF